MILDHERAHYVLLEYQARERCIRIYDPLIPSEFDYETLLNLVNLKITFLKNICTE